MPDWWTNEWWTTLLFNVLQGALGAFIGLIGLFGVYWVTRKHQLDKEAKQETLDGVAQILRKTTALRHREPDYESSVRSLSDELLLFSLRESTRNPGTAAWSRYHSFELLEALKDRTLTARMSGYIAGYLSSWVAHDFNGFSDEKSSEESAERSWKDAREEIEKDRKERIERIKDHHVPESSSSNLRRFAHFLWQVFRRPARAEETRGSPPRAS